MKLFLKRINKILFGNKQTNQNSFINTPIKCRTIMPYEGVTMEQWESGDWIKFTNPYKPIK